MTPKKSIFEPLDAVTKELLEAEEVVRELKEAKSEEIRKLLDGPLDGQKTFKRKIDGKEVEFMIAVTGGTKKGEDKKEGENPKIHYSIRARTSSMPTLE